MESSVDRVPVAEAASRLGVSEQRVRAMIASGRLPAEKLGGIWLIPQRAISRDRRAAVRPGRPLSPAHAWAVLLLASDEDDLGWLGRQSRWRLRSALRRHGLGDLCGRLVHRGDVHRYEAHSGELAYLAQRPELMRTGPSAAGEHGLGLHGGSEFQAYVAADALAGFVEEHALEAVDPAGTGNVVLCSVPDDVWAHVARPVAPLAAVLVDLIESEDPRARRIGADGVRRLDEAREL
jgi:excisionase family DNA binding protein